MDGQPSQPRTANIARWCPPARLLKGPGIALDARKMILAAVGLAVLGAGWEGLAWLFRRFDVVGFGVRVDPEGLFPPDGSLGPPVLSSGLAAAVAEPFRVLMGPFGVLFSRTRGVAAFAHAGLAAIWCAVVWGIVGGAIARIAAVQQATGERIGMGSAVRFAIGRSVALIGAPLAPMIGIGFFAALCVPIGLLYRLPGTIGPTVAGVLAFLPLLAGLMMALLLVGLAAGWPLMIATVAVEAEDAFDALSRAYSYVSSRPGRYAAYVVICWAAGVAGLFVVALFAWLVPHLAQWALAFGGPADRIDALFNGSPASATTPATAHAAWLVVVRLLMHGWIYSYFFTSAILIYVLLRRDVDGAPYDDVGGLDAEDEPFAPEPEPEPGAVGPSEMPNVAG